MNGPVKVIPARELPPQTVTSEAVGESPLRSAEIQMTIIRADGTVEEVGTVSYWHSNPLRRLYHSLFVAPKVEKRIAELNALHPIEGN